MSYKLVQTPNPVRLWLNFISIGIIMVQTDLIKLLCFLLKLVLKMLHSKEVLNKEYIKRTLNSKKMIK